ncbi:hypothetical protein HXX76_008782 [Chlamydomonas incerta]|uniref:Mce/MlaD domain-containing protein n=1 Tax=Chlamydomonas incerta TaxID=51695 RepID=A0A835SV73_CHLIN|nr:hypothetical protein HXX76_008782 [Chlamydomonas incerta]|eukprot:KAG2432436.1 hypothetical protein HXX76_008782 [Chlamydomonas incerta]
MPLRATWAPAGPRTGALVPAPSRPFGSARGCRAAAEGSGSGSGDNGGHPPGSASTSSHAHSSTGASASAGTSSNGPPGSAGHGASGAHGRSNPPHIQPPHPAPHHPHHQPGATVASEQGGATASQDGGVGGSTDAAAHKGLVHSGSRASFKNVMNRAYTGEMLFVLGGSLIGAALCHWTVGTSLRRFNPYSFHLALPTASGVVTGTPLRMKGVPMGSVLTVKPRLDHVEVEVEVNEVKTIIPRNAKVELTQSGMIPAAAIDISIPEGVSAEVLAAMVAARQQQQQQQQAAAGGTAGSSSGTGSEAAAASGAKGEGGGKEGGKEAAVKKAKRGAAKPVKLASPKDVAACQLQGVLVCHGDKLDGLQGGSMDELMAHMLKQLRQGEPELATGGTVPGRGPMQG